MSDFNKKNATAQSGRSGDQRWISFLLWGGVGCGVSSFLIGLFIGAEAAVWQALLINTLFFTGLAHGSLMFSVMLTITRAKWGRPIKRFAEAPVLFIPVSWLLFLLLLLGMDHFFEWADAARALPEKTWWLNRPFFITRNLILILATGMVGLAYVFHSLKPDIMFLKAAHPSAVGRLVHKLIGRADAGAKEQPTSYERHSHLAPLLAALYLITSCVIAFDWIMSIDQSWYSTAFGFQFATGNLYAAGAFLIILFTFAQKKERQQTYFTPQRLNDLSRLVFAICLCWTYLVYSQVLVIWYANLPEETSYLVLRMNSEEWSGMFLFLSFSLFLIPFLGLFSKTACRSSGVSSVIAFIILIGLWWEKYYLAVPSIQTNFIDQGPLPGFQLTAWDITITIGICAAFLLCLRTFLHHFPMLPVSDPFLSEGRPSSQS